MEILTFLAFYIGICSVQSSQQLVQRPEDSLILVTRRPGSFHFCVLIWGLFSLPRYTCALAALVVHQGLLPRLLVSDTTARFMLLLLASLLDNISL